ncbi:DUF308 domain-containing protein [Bacillus sp. FJAT-27245]|uniref:DUF308 domain-containing protein n=1 Tax=Bacillus sp. FJAT-27245 TaxID=1684144 RepID=UPI000A57DA52|nr:DUF308 domain-containing protein [Bacillus sp. FJAT-27245]
MADQSRDNNTMQQNYSREGQPSNYNEETSTESVLLLPEPTGTPGMNSSASASGTGNTGYQEETAAEIAAPVSVRQNREGQRAGGREMDRDTAGGMLGFAALVSAILSLFVMPVILGAAGIIIGFLAMRRGATKSGGWAIGIGAISLIIGIFITPFF